MKIAVGIFTYFPFGGLQVDMKNISLELARRGAEVTIYTGEWADHCYPKGVSVKVLPLSGLSNHAKALDFARKFHAESGDADIKIAFNRFGGCDFYFAADDCYLAALRRKKGAFLLRHLGRCRTFSALEEAVFSPESRTKIFYIAERQKNEFQTCYGTQEERFILLNPGVKDSYVPPEAGVRAAARRSLDVKDQLICLFVAANWQLKGGDRVLEAFAALPEEMKKQIQLHFTGGDGNGFARKRAEALKIDAYCRFHGPQKDMLPFYHAADVLVHPARKEAAGNVIAESIASGVPVICSGVCGFADLVSKSGAGIVLPEPFVMENLLDAWQKWYAQRAGFSEMARSAQTKISLHGRAQQAADAVLSGSRQGGIFSINPFETV